jgi:hypothetical protein
VDLVAVLTPENEAELRGIEEFIELAKLGVSPRQYYQTIRDQTPSSVSWLTTDAQIRNPFLGAAGVRRI